MNLTKDTLGRRQFLKRSLVASVAATVGYSNEEKVLLAQNAPATTPPATAAVPAANSLPTGRIRHVQISRLICGGNLISGYAHSRDLIYVSDLLKHYFTDEKIMETWALCEAARHQHHDLPTRATGTPSRSTASTAARGGKIQYLAQIDPEPRKTLKHRGQRGGGRRRRGRVSRRQLRAIAGRARGAVGPSASWSRSSRTRA